MSFSGLSNTPPDSSCPTTIDLSGRRPCLVRPGDNLEYDIVMRLAGPMVGAIDRHFLGLDISILGSGAHRSLRKWHALPCTRRQSERRRHSRRGRCSWLGTRPYRGNAKPTIGRHRVGVGISLRGAGCRPFCRQHHRLPWSARLQLRRAHSCGERCSTQSRLPIEPQRDQAVGAISRHGPGLRISIGGAGTLAPTYAQRTLKGQQLRTALHLAAS